MTVTREIEEVLAQVDNWLTPGQVVWMEPATWQAFYEWMVRVRALLTLLQAEAARPLTVDAAARKLCSWFRVSFDGLSNEGRVTDRGFPVWGPHGFQGRQQDVRDMVQEIAALIAPPARPDAAEELAKAVEKALRALHRFPGMRSDVDQCEALLEAGLATYRTANQESEVMPTEPGKGNLRTEPNTHATPPRPSPGPEPAGGAMDAREIEELVSELRDCSTEIPDDSWIVTAKRLMHEAAAALTTDRTQQGK